MKRLPLLLVFLAAPAAGAAAAQDAIDEAKAHYAAAAYEDALSTLTRADSAAPAARKVELEQYKAFCFIALGRMVDAERAVASLVAADPTYVPSPTVASPKVLQLVSDMRRKELPGVARKLFEDGRTAFKEKAFDRAQRNFDVLLGILSDPILKGRPETDDLRVLAEGFVALADASAAAPPAPDAAEAPAAAVPQETVIEPPVALVQTLPDWIPPDKVAGSREYLGSLKVTIGTDGKVKTAAIEKPSYPTYDARLLQAARFWVYKPATRNGRPVESEKLIAVQLRRRN